MPILEMFIPIIMVLVIGIVLVAYFYLRSKEKQLIIEKGLDTESIKLLYSNNKTGRSSYNLMKIGIIAVSFGIGIGLGLGLTDNGPNDFWKPLCIFVFTGIGFIVANIVGNKLDNKDNRKD